MSNSPVIAFLNKMTDLILLNVIWLLCCLPVVTTGAATTAAYYVSITSIRCGDGYVVKRFFQFPEKFPSGYACVDWRSAVQRDSDG